MFVTYQLTVLGFILFVTRFLCSTCDSVNCLPLFETAWFSQSDFSTVVFVRSINCRWIVVVLQLALFRLWNLMTHKSKANRDWEKISALPNRLPVKKYRVGQTGLPIKREEPGCVYATCSVSLILLVRFVCSWILLQKILLSQNYEFGQYIASKSVRL